MSEVREPKERIFARKIARSVETVYIVPSYLLRRNCIYTGSFLMRALRLPWCDFLELFHA